MKSEILKAQKAKNKAELAHVHVQAKSEIEQVKANYALIFECLDEDRLCQDALNKHHHPTAESEKVSSALVKIVKELKTRQQSPEGEEQSRACSSRDPILSGD